MIVPVLAGKYIDDGGLDAMLDAEKVGQQHFPQVPVKRIQSIQFVKRRASFVDVFRRSRCEERSLISIHDVIVVLVAQDAAGEFDARDLHISRLQDGNLFVDGLVWLHNDFSIDTNSPCADGSTGAIVCSGVRRMPIPESLCAYYMWSWIYCQIKLDKRRSIFFGFEMPCGGRECRLQAADATECRACLRDRGGQEGCIPQDRTMSRRKKRRDQGGLQKRST